MSELLCSVNSSGDLVALCTSDGIVKFYDTLSSTLKLEYISSTHLQAQCTCLSWSKHKSTSTLSALIASNRTKKIKKSETNIEQELQELDLIAIGTSQGSILLFSTSKASLHTLLVDNGHIDSVNDIAWCSQLNDSLYSCSNDGHIIEWSLMESKCKHKWKASKSQVTSIALDSTSKYLLSSSKIVTLWNLASRNKLKTFTGHSNDIHKLKFLPHSCTHFVSSALGDRFINLWHVGELTDEKNVTNSLVSFVCNDSPLHLDVSYDQESSLILYTITAKGNLCVYRHILNGKSTNLINKKPIKATNQIEIQTEDGLPLNLILCYHLLNHNHQLNGKNSTTSVNQIDNNLLIAYGTYLAPKFERLALGELKDEKIKLIKQDPYKLSVSMETQITKIEKPNVPNDVKVLVPGYMMPLNSVSASKRKSTEPSQMSLEERLNAIGIDDAKKIPVGSNNVIPKADNLLVLLVQGLQSNDSKILNHILQNRNDKVINKTIRLLPTNYIINLFKELSKRIQGHAQAGLGIIKWLKALLMTHTSFLMSYPDLIESLSFVYEMMNARTKLFPQLTKLQGKLQLVMSQVSAQAESMQAESTLAQVSSTNDESALLYYQDSTSEDEQLEDDLIPSHSEFDDYLFSDEDDEEEDDEDEDIDDEGNVSEGDEEKVSNQKDDDDDDEKDEDDDVQMNGTDEDNDNEEVENEEPQPKGIMKQTATFKKNNLKTKQTESDDDESMDLEEDNEEKESKQPKKVNGTHNHNNNINSKNSNNNNKKSNSKNNHVIKRDTNKKKKKI